MAGLLIKLFLEGGLNMLRVVFMVAALLMSLPSLAAETWKVTSLEWPPFTGKSLPEGGAGTAVLRAALKAEGIELKVEFYQWARALMMAKNPAYVGVFPVWPEEVEEGFTPSPVLFKSPVGLVELKNKPLKWNTLEDLKGKNIGTVQGYGNTIEFMTLIKNGTIKTQVVPDDITNIKKVAGGRIDGAFIDLNNLEYFFKNDAKHIATKLQANKKVIGSKALLLSINNSFPNKQSTAILNRGLSKINAQKIIREYMTKYMK
ncbi:MAG: ABC transporter substrate-binding protein [Gallionellaceae bacterium]